jgi:hypothetical protein
MSDSLLEKLVDLVLSGGAGGVVALLLLAVGFLIWERVKMVQELKEKTAENRDTLLEIIDKYHDGQLSIIEAINEIKIVLAKIEGRL